MKKMKRKLPLLGGVLIAGILLAGSGCTNHTELGGESEMRDQQTIEQQAERLMEYLDCPCTHFPPTADDKSIMDAYRQARERGEKEGFVPMLVVVDEILLENFEFSVENKTTAQVRQELLDTPLDKGKEFLQIRLDENKECLDEYEPGEWDRLMGEITDGQAVDRFQGYWSYETPKTNPLILAEIPVKHPWEVFAYLPFGGWNACPLNEEHMAAAKCWFEEYGAVPAVLTHDVLEYDLPAPVPQDKAMELALEQYAYCPDIVSQGVGTIGRLADGLTKSHYWYFWWD